MRIGINLSSDPFRRDRPLLIATAALAALLLVSLSAFIWLALSDRADRQPRPPASKPA